MMVYTKTYEAPPVDRREILRYAGVRGDAPEIEILLEECLAEAMDKERAYKNLYATAEEVFRLIKAFN